MATRRQPLRVAPQLADVDERHNAVARRAWQLMFDYLTTTSGARSAVLARYRLTPNDSRGLWSLSPDEGRPIGDLARQWGCDPSTATFIIDRLERAGFARRRQSPSDRRVKLVLLTANGARTRATLLEQYHQPPAELLALSESELAALARILAKLSVPQPPAAAAATERRVQR